MDYLIDTKTGISDSVLTEFVSSKLKKFKDAKKVLIIHPDYTRLDFTSSLVQPIIKFFKERQVIKIDFLNAGGTHRKMTESEIALKLGIRFKEDFIDYYNHEFDKSEKLVKIGEISGDFVSERTKGQLNDPIPVTVNKILFDNYDLIIALSGTSPHEAAGFSGGLKIFFPGVSGPEVINLFHWAAVLVGLPYIIGTSNNVSRDIIGKGASCIFKEIQCPVVSINMVSIEKEEIQPAGIFFGESLNGFIQTYEDAVSLSQQLHIRYVNKPLKTAVQVMPACYDEVWLAGKGSYKLQKPGVMQEGGEIIIYAPNVRCFHSNKSMEDEILGIGYHCKDYVLEFIKSNPGFSRNVASHVINVTGPGTYDFKNRIENKKYNITLATSIPEAICKKVGLGYINPSKIKKKDFLGEDILWEDEGGKYLYDLRDK
jgi:lactate racemase